MMTQTIHIVCLDAPSPPDYGGAIDMFYKVRALGKAGHRIILHYFDYNPLRHVGGLELYCSEIHAYKRKNILRSLPLSRPFIVQSRINSHLIDRLNGDLHPILLEGLHCAGIVPLLKNQSRVVLRMHNEEASYYQHLAKTEKGLLKKFYFLQESRLLHQYQQSFDKKIQLACLSETDMQQFEKAYRFQQLSFLPCFIPWQSLNCQPGSGQYCLYHGNLSVSENEEAVLWLIQNVFDNLNIPFVIAGKGMSKKLLAIAGKQRHVKLINNPPIDEIDALVRDAHINVLPSMNATGVKLKLLNALLNGRFCITNENGVKGSRIQQGVIVQNKADNWKSSIQELMKQEFSRAQIEERQEILSLYNNGKNAQKLSALWKHCQ